jgi:HAD superfamily hydrolase (TIGR01509 family)
MQFGFILDLDGTILDTTRYYRAVWEDLIREFKSPYAADELLKRSARDGFRKMLGANYPDEELAAQVARLAAMSRARMETEGVVIHRGIRELIAGLNERGVKLAVATLAEPANVEYPLKQLGLYDYFDALVTDADVKRSKPFPDVYLEAIRRLGVVTENCAALEDAPNGIESAKRAGLSVIAVLTTHTREQLQNADWIVASAEQLTAENVIKFISE